MQSTTKKLIMLSLGRKGGVPIYAFQMAVSLLKMNCELVCYISKYVENIAAWRELRKEYPRCIIIEVKTYNTKFEFILQSINLMKLIMLAHSINNQSATHVYIPGTHYWIPFLCLFLKQKYLITTIHDYTMHLGEKNFFAELLNDFVIRKSNKIIVLSKVFIKNISRRYNISVGDINYIQHGNYNYYVFNYEQSNIIYKRTMSTG